MKISFKKEEFLKGLNTAMKAVAVSTTMPLLKCVLINASSNKINLISNDMELAVITAVNGAVAEEGKIALEARIFYEIIKKLPDDVVIMTVNDRYIANIRCGKSEFNIPGIDPSDFPYPPEIEKNYFIGMSQFTLKEMIRQTIFSLNPSEKNKLMTGELFEIKNNTLRIVALDGHRISIRKIPLFKDYENVKIVIPGKALSEISKILSDNIDDQIDVCISKNHILFEFDETRVYSRLIEGEYFHIDNMLTSDFPVKSVIDKKEFYECLERASLLIKEGENKPVILNINEGYLELSATTAFGSMNESFEVEKEGEDIRIGFNPRYLMDVLKVIDDEKITAYMLNGKSPCYIKDVGENYIYLILPVNLM